MLLFVVVLACPRPPPSTSAPASPGRLPPPARQHPTTETRFGIVLEDPFRWMEAAENAQELRDWIVGQDAVTRAHLDALPGLSALSRRVTELEAGRRTVAGLQVRGERRFFLETEPGGVARLVVQEGDAVRVLVDPADLDEGGGALHAFSASPDGRYVAFNYASDGSEVCHVRVVEHATGALLPLDIPAIWGEFAAAWLPDASGFFYTQLDLDALDDPNADVLRGMTSHLHRIAGRTDVPVLGPEVAGPMTIEPSEFPVVWTAPGSDWVLGTGLNARAELRLAVVRVDALGQSPVPWRPVAEFEDSVIDAELHGDSLYLLSTARSPNGEVLRLDARTPDLASAEVVVAVGDALIEDIGVTADGIYTQDHRQGSGGLVLYRTTGASHRFDVPPGRTVRLDQADDRGVWFRTVGYDQPRTYFRVVDGASTATGLGDGAAPGFPEVVVMRAEATSADGVRVPMTVLHLRDLPRDGRRPTMVHGYAAYGITMTPYYWPALMALLERGAVYTACHARGGGANGPAWHAAGKGPNKAVGVADFVACAEELAKMGLTTPEHTGAWTASMGGVLVGGALVDSPRAFRAVAMDVPFLNPVRYLASQNGANQTAELGATPETEAGLRTLVAMDPFHGLVEGTAYPATLLTVGLEDQRVETWMSVKFAAKLQSLQSQRNRTSIRAYRNEGHGVGASTAQRARRLADTFGFLLSELGHPDFQVR